jgi:hypothetical protein
MLDAASWIARAISTGRASRDWFIQSAIRSALRGPIPGIRRNCATNSVIGPGYSTLFIADCGSEFADRNRDAGALGRQI